MRRYLWLLILPLLGCPPKPTPSPTPGPTPTPDPTPTPVESCCNVPLADAPGWALVTPKPPAYNQLFIVEAEAAIGDVCGKLPDESLTRLAAELVSKRNLCAAQWKNADGSRIDAVIVLRPDGIFEEWHAVAYTDGCWFTSGNAYKNAWRGPQMKGCE
jgi:hypothetical protein